MFLIVLLLALVVLSLGMAIAERSRHVPSHLLYEEMRAAHELRSIEARTIREMLRAAQESPGDVIEGTATDTWES
jgi:hypothetical protein